MNNYSNKIEWSIQAKLHLLNVMFREASKIAYFKGILVYIKPSKKIYGLSEYRNDDSNIMSNSNI